MFKFWNQAKKETDKSVLDKGLLKTKAKLSHRLWNLVSQNKLLDESVQHEIQTILLSSDVGRETSRIILQEMVDKIRINHGLDADLKSQMITVLTDLIDSWMTTQEPFPKSNETQITLMVGVNGAGKTTTMAKLAHILKSRGLSVMMAAGDTFREAAIEQLQVWADRIDVPLVAQSQGSDSAAVIYDAYQSAVSKKCDWLLADTAGRLHNKRQLMDELAKVKRVVSKINPSAPHQVWLVLDANVGQAGLEQVRSFHEAVGLNGLIVTKLDGTARGGVVFSVLQQFGIPIHYIGLGESLEDYEPFEPKAFVEALFNDC